MNKLDPRIQKFIYIQLFVMTLIIIFLKSFKIDEERLVIILMIIVGSITLIIYKKRIEEINKK
ncbi:MAG TPA: hypothetical protein DHV28_02585 [Ignavibacteriales bacterium]|nr:hypothetical protein [Ignavibacteriales bacterium]